MEIKKKFQIVVNAKEELNMLMRSSQSMEDITIDPHWKKSSLRFLSWEWTKWMNSKEWEASSTVENLKIPQRKKLKM